MRKKRTHNEVTSDRVALNVLTHDDMYCFFWVWELRCHIWIWETVLWNTFYLSPATCRFSFCKMISPVLDMCSKRMGLIQCRERKGSKDGVKIGGMNIVKDSMDTARVFWGGKRLLPGRRRGIQFLGAWPGPSGLDLALKNVFTSEERIVKKGIKEESASHGFAHLLKLTVKKFKSK